jgi:trimethylamine--corrinoid protein Co-methyltransferase
MLAFNVLDKDEVEAIHQATLRVLNETGIILRQAEGQAIFSGGGAAVQGERVRLPPGLVEAQLAGCPHQVSLRGRGGQSKVLGDGSLSWHNLGGARDIYEPEHRRYRPATVQDVRDSARLLDALESVTSVTPFFTPQDVPGELMSLAMYRHSLGQTSKPLQGPGMQTAQEVHFVARMAEVIGPPPQVLSLSVSPVSPLFFPDEAVGAILEIARLGVPFGPLPCPTAGTTAPFSLAGALTQQNAEVLAAITLAQLARPGLPVVYCGRLAMMEPHSGISVWGGVELGLASAATVQIAHRYGLPVNVYGLSTNAHVLDIQNGSERALNAALPALAGADELSGIGEVEAGVSGSYTQMVCDDEIAAGIKRLRRGFAADAQALAVEVIAAAMQGSRNFLGQKHTLKYLRAGEVLITCLAERGAREQWERDGSQNMAERAQAQAERLLREHNPLPLSQEQESELDAIMAEAESQLVQP